MPNFICTTCGTQYGESDQAPERGHEIGRAVKDRLIGGIITVRDVLVHIEPFLHG